MGKHAKFSPSSGKRYLECPPALCLERQFPDTSSAYAEEGTAGHALAEHLIKKYLKKRTKKPISAYLSDELAESVGEYVLYVIGQIETARKEDVDPFIAVELKVSLKEYTSDCFGTADAVIVTSRKIHVMDLKLGKGVRVDADHNVQLMIYGLGVLSMLDMLYPVETVEMTIVQPRIEHFSTWEIPAEELRKWGREIFSPAAKMALAGEGEFKAGEHCRFCRARIQCRARNEYFLKLAQKEFAAPALLSDEEIAEVLAKADDLKKWVQEIYTYAQDEAITHHRVWPGYKLVHGRSIRKYVSEDEAADAAKNAGYTDIYKQSLIGITEMEALMGKKRFKEILGSHVYKPEGKLTLVPESDKREAVKTATAEADFKEE